MQPRGTDRRRLVIREPRALKTLLRRRAMYPSQVDIRLELPNLSAEQREVYERRLTAAHLDCGCALGAAMGLGLLAVFIVLTLLGVGIQLGWARVGVAFVVFLFGSGVGKGIGLARARASLESTITEVIKMQSGAGFAEPNAAPESSVPSPAERTCGRCRGERRAARVPATSSSALASHKTG